MTKAANQLRDITLTNIAKNICFVETLETRNTDGDDFNDIAVWNLKAALEQAYKAGLEAAGAKT